MKFNQKIYLIPAAKYEKLVSDSKNKNHPSSQVVQTNSKTDEEKQNISENFQSQVEKIEKVPEPSVHSDENSEEQGGEYSQTFSFKNPKQSGSEKNFQFHKQFSAENQVIFPPPGIPEKNFKTTRKQKKSFPVSFTTHRKSEKTKESAAENKKKSVSQKKAPEKRHKKSDNLNKKTEKIQESPVKKQKISDNSKKVNWVSLK